MPQMARCAERHKKHGIGAQVVIPMRHRQCAAVGVEWLTGPPALLALPVRSVFDGAGDLLPVDRVELALHGHGVTLFIRTGLVGVLCLA